MSHMEMRSPRLCKRKGRHVCLISKVKQADEGEKENDDNNERYDLFSINITQH